MCTHIHIYVHIYVCTSLLASSSRVGIDYYLRSPVNYPAKQPAAHQLRKTISIISLTYRRHRRLPTALHTYFAYPLPLSLSFSLHCWSIVQEDHDHKLGLLFVEEEKESTERLNLVSIEPGRWIFDPRWSLEVHLGEWKWGEWIGMIEKRGNDQWWLSRRLEDTGESGNNRKEANCLGEPSFLNAGRGTRLKGDTAHSDLDVHVR